MIFYFAYGSNMNPARMTRRVGEFTIIGLGILDGYELVFNKKAKGKKGIGYANVEHVIGQKVEGVLYQFDAIEKLDQYEGYPDHYDREMLTVLSDKGKMEAWVYKAKHHQVGQELLPSPDYLKHILKGKPFLSSDYYNVLSKTKTS